MYISRSIGEMCDDGDLLNGDGCSRACELEEGFNCAGESTGLGLYLTFRALSVHYFVNC